jgi:hypothetical protein
MVNTSSKRLSRMRMPAVAGVHHMDIGPDVACDEMRSAALAVPDDEHVGIHRGQVGNGIEQRLALGLRRRRDVEIHHVGRQRLAAISNVVRVRVLGSKNRLKIALPRSSGPSSLPVR